MRHPLQTALLGVTLCPCALAWCCSAAAGEAVDSPEEPARAYVEQLGSASYHQRERASEQLRRLGAKARPFLEQALSNPDLEVRQSAQRLLHRLHEDDLWEPTRVTLRDRAQPARRIFAEIARQTGFRVAFGETPESANDPLIELDCAGTPFWEAMDIVSRMSGNQVRLPNDPRQPGVVVHAGSLPTAPVAYAGPLRLAVASARQVEISEMDFLRRLAQRSSSLHVSFQLAWEERFKPVCFFSELELIEARTNTGELLASEPAAGRGWSPLPSRCNQFALSLRLSTPGQVYTRLDRLQVRVALIGVGQMRELKLLPLPCAGAPDEPCTRSQDGREVTVEQVEQRADRWEIAVRVQKPILPVEPGPLPRRILDGLDEGLMSTREEWFEAVDAQDRPLSFQGMTFIHESQVVRYRLQFAADPTHGAPVALRYIYPQLRSFRELDFDFRAVELPAR